MSRRSIRKEAKAAEQQFAILTGMKRVPAGVAAQQRQGDADLVSPGRLMQVKHRRWPTWLREALEQIQAAQAGTGKRALIGLKLKPGPGQKAWLLICEVAQDWVDWNGKNA